MFDDEAVRFKLRTARSGVHSTREVWLHCRGFLITLRGSLVVHGADLEKLAKKAISDSGLRLSWDREEDLLQELLVVAWELSEKHDEQRYPGQFPAGCYRRLKFRVVDWVRKTEGRTRWQFSEEGAKRAKRRHHRTLEHDGNVSVVVEYQRPAVLSLDAPVGADSDTGLGETLEGRRSDIPGDSAAQSGLACPYPTSHRSYE